MPEQNPRYVNVDDLQQQIDWQEACAFYGVDPGELHRSGNEIRTKCFLNCGKAEETGNRALAIDASHPQKRWRCHQYSCGKGGNLVGLCDLMKPGTHANGKPRGERFKEIRDDLMRMVGGTFAGESPPVTAPQMAPPAAEPVLNIPLAQAESERVRALVDLDRKFLVEADETMNKHAAAYLRQRPYLTPEVCRKWRCGYLPHDTGGDRSGGTMRGKFVYPVLDAEGSVLTWFGRDPEYEAKHRKWMAGGKLDREPQKHHFVKGFHRGQELFGLHVFSGESFEHRWPGLGVVVVEGPNDVIALDCLGVSAVALCSNRITKTQSATVADLARRLDRKLVTLLLDCDAEGESGAVQALPAIAEHVPVRLAWSPTMHGGQFKGRQPESLSSEEWLKIHDAIS